MTDDVKGADPIPSPEPLEGASGSQTLKTEDVEKIVQRETDRVRTELYQKLKLKDTEIEKLKTSNMSEVELRKHQEKQLKERERELAQKELRLFATDYLKDNGVPLEFRDFVIADNEEQTKARILTLRETLQKAVELAVQDKFKSVGHDPGKSNTPPSAATVIDRNQLKSMSREEIQKNLPAYMDAMKEGRIKK